MAISMTKLATRFATGVVFAASAMPALADCGIEAGSVRILSNDFDALRLINERATECATDSVSVTFNQTQEHKSLQVPALSIDPAEYTVAVIANNSLPPLLNDGLVRPLDDLVEKYGQNLTEQQLIRIDGKVMAIAFMVNGQHLFYRKDLLEEAGLEVPTTYEELLEAAAVLEELGKTDYPYAASVQAGWELAEEFVNMYSATGADFFAPGSAEVAINNENGVAALEMMKALTEYQSPDYMSVGSSEASKMFRSGEVAMTVIWASQAGPVLDPEGDNPEIAAVAGLAAAPSFQGNGIPAATLFWDGFAISKNISDEDAEASFQAMMHATAPEFAEENSYIAAWLIKGYEPTPGAVGIMADVAQGARGYPTLPFMDLLHSALGSELADFMQGNESAEQALADIEAAYSAAATERGFLN
ncbi:ABC transporter substrate-binding protein [Marivivens niveibacter]|nr:extracellular solute-binding protein [Marivivens niveibacter]